MSIPVTCSCGQQFMAQPHLAGKRVPCPSCGNPLTIPTSADQPSSPAGEPAGANIVTCQCGQSFKAPPHLLGQRVPCPSCGQPIDIPAAPGSDPPKPTPVAPVASSPAPKAAAETRPKPATASPKPAPKAAAAPEPDLAWDDALGTPMSADVYGGFGGAPAQVPRRAETEHIQPMTMYAMWIGGGAVVLLILVILGHLIWNFFSGGDSDEVVPDQPVESAPAETPQTPPATPPAEESPAKPEAKPDEKPAAESTSARSGDRARSFEGPLSRAEWWHRTA